MEKYELKVILHEKTTSAKIKALRTKLDKVLAEIKGKVVEETSWGKKDLSYKIKNLESGVYVHYLLELNSENVKKLDDSLKLDETVMRHLLVKGE